MQDYAWCTVPKVLNSIQLGHVVELHQVRLWHGFTLTITEASHIYTREGRGHHQLPMALAGEHSNYYK